MTMIMIMMINTINDMKPMVIIKINIRYIENMILFFRNGRKLNLQKK